MLLVREALLHTSVKSLFMSFQVSQPEGIASTTLGGQCVN